MPELDEGDEPGFPERMSSRNRLIALYKERSG
jgi:hypothetical protein